MTDMISEEQAADKAAIYLEENYISGDTMVELDHNVPKGKEGLCMYVCDLMGDFLIQAIKEIQEKK